MMKLTNRELKIRNALANYMSSEGCSCCRGNDYDKNREILAKLLNVEKYDDNSGYNFNKYSTQELKSEIDD